MTTSAAFQRRLDEVTADLSAGRHAQALAAAKALVASYPDAARAHNIYGILRAGANDGSGAVESLKSAVALEPDFGEAHYNLGLALCQIEMFAPAVESLRRAVELEPRNAANYLILGNALRRLGRLDEAAGAYERAMNIGGIPEAMVRNNLGAVYLDLNHLDKALASFRRAAELQPGFAGTHLNIGNTLLRLGRAGEALTSFRMATELEPKSATAALLFANTLRDLGRLEDSVSAYRTVLALRPDDKQASYHLGLTLLHMGRNAEGMRVIKEGPGLARVSCAPAVTGREGAAPRRIEIAAGSMPTFIGAWGMPHPDLCERLIAFFERNADRHGAGRTGAGIDKAAKDSTDLTILPCDLGKPEFAAAAEYISHLEECYRDYVVQWPYLGGIMPQGEIVPFTIQKYVPGGHFQRVHAERTSSGFAHRVLAWMTYLDGVEEGGETRFHYYGIDIRPERGKTLIWPAEWTHAHAGTVVRKGCKHIITGWIHFPQYSG